MNCLTFTKINPVALTAAALLTLAPLVASAQTTAPDTTSSTTTTMPVTPAPLTVPTSVKPQASTTPAGAEDIRDIRGPKPVPTYEVLIAGMILGAILAVIAGAVGFWYWRKHYGPKLPYEIALARLEKARALMQPDQAREFSIEVSEVIRSYVEARFHVFATNRTTEEFLHDLLEPSDALLAHHQELLGDFLQHCDLAKFARGELSVDEMNQMLTSACLFVTQTGKPVAPVKEKSSPVSAPATTTQPANA